FITALFITALLGAVSLGLSVKAALVILWIAWLVYLPAQTWLEFLAGMSYDRVKNGGEVALPPPGERNNTRDGVWIVTHLLWPPAAFDNYILAQLAAVFYFHVVPIPWRDVGLTKLLNRLVDTRPDKRDKALAVRKRWLS